MPDGVTHFQAGVLAGAVAVALTWLWQREALRPVLVGTAAGLILTPDLDQEGRTFTERLLRHIPVIGLAFQWAWYPYATLTAHRGLSHALGMGTVLTPFTTWVGTATRIAYAVVLSALTLAALMFVSFMGGGDPRTWQQPLLEAWRWFLSPALLLAWCWQDFVHTCLDYVTGE